MNRHSLREFYLHQVLPALFEQLDRAFPEFHWTRTTIGWKATRRAENGAAEHAHYQTIYCHQPWGLVAADGTAESWLSYVNGGETPTADQFASAVHELARRAQVTTGIHVEGWSETEIQSAVGQQRQADLLEQFVAYCQRQLDGPVGQSMLCGLREHYGITASDHRDLSVGVYTTPGEVGEFLLSRGFSHDEIVQSAVAGDQRLSDRLVIPWRDRWGQLRTIVARDVSHRSDTAGRDLYLKGGTRTGIFGLDVALRDSSQGKKHLVLVDSVLDVIYLQTLGVRNVATVAGHKKMPIHEHWQLLAQAGVTAVTFAAGDCGVGANQTVQAIGQMNLAARSPEVYVVVASQFGDDHGAAAYVRRHGLTSFRDMLKQRIHGYRYVAGDLVGRHRPADGWSESSLTSMLVEAVNFDAQVSDPQRARQLERHFWPMILESTGLDWESLQASLKNRYEKVPADWPAKWNSRNLKQLMRQLRGALKQEDYAQFRQLICSAAHDLQADQPAQSAATAFPPQTRFDAEQWRPLIVHGRTAHLPPSYPSLESTSPALDNRWTRPVEPSLGDIRALAYQLWEANGRPDGRDHDFWYQAERELGLHESSAEPHQWDESAFRAA